MNKNYIFASLALLPMAIFPFFSYLLFGEEMARDTFILASLCLGAMIFVIIPFIGFIFQILFIVFKAIPMIEFNQGEMGVVIVIALTYIILGIILCLKGTKNFLEEGD